MRHIISVMVENESGALSRIAGLFSARGFNIESLTVAPTHDQTLSRLTVVSKGSDRVIEQIVKQLEKLIDVVSVIDLTGHHHFEREMLLIKVKKSALNLNELCAEYEAKILKETDEIYTIELSRRTEIIEEFINEFNLIDIVEIARSGVTGLLQD